MVELKRQIMKVILDNPGPSRESLRAAFGLNDYRLSKVLRHIERELTGRAVIGDRENGVWIVAVDDHKCLGMIWLGRAMGGYRQCEQAPCFSDRRCYEHSEFQDPEMLAFLQYVRYLAGPAKPTAYAFLSLGIVRVQELLERILGTVPASKKDRLERERYVKMLRAAYATLKWRALRRGAAQRTEIPFELWERHRRSAINPFEFSVKKYFEVLEIPVDSTRDQVVKAWKNLCRLYHPDLERGDEERMKKINLAKDRIFRIRRWT
jgi:hypothetical protein